MDYNFFNREFILVLLLSATLFLYVRVNRKLIAANRALVKSYEEHKKVVEVRYKDIERISRIDTTLRVNLAISLMSYNLTTDQAKQYLDVLKPVLFETYATTDAELNYLIDGTIADFYKDIEKVLGRTRIVPDFPNTGPELGMEPINETIH